MGKHGPVSLGAFHQKHFTGDRACLVAVGGIEHNKLAKLGESLDLGKGAGKTLVHPIDFHTVQPAIFLAPPPGSRSL